MKEKALIPFSRRALSIIAGYGFVLNAILGVCTSRAALRYVGEGVAGIRAFLHHDGNYRRRIYCSWCEYGCRMDSRHVQYACFKLESQFFYANDWFYSRLLSGVGGQSNELVDLQ